VEISKVIVPSSYTDSSFFPLIKSIPKEMVPILGKPAIQFIAEEAYKSALDNFFLVIGNQKESIFNFFNNLSLNDKLKEKIDAVQDFEKILKYLQFNYIYQSEPLGIGNAILLARNVVHKEYFAIALPDDIIISKQPTLSQIIRIARQEKASVIAVQEVPTDSVSNCNIVSIKKQITQNLFQLSHIVEKPNVKDAPSSLAVVGRYVLSHKIFNSLEYINNYASEQLKFSDAISHMMHQNERVFAFKIPGLHYDISTQLGWVKLIISMALQDPNLSDFVQEYLAHIQKTELFYYNPAKVVEHTL